MSEYNLFAGVDAEYRFPPEVRAALLESLNIRNVGAPMTTAQRNALPTASLDPGYYIFNTDTQGFQIWRADFEEWHDGLETPGSEKYWPGPVIPAGWMKHDGRALPRDKYFALFKAINTTYGNPSPTHFNIPNTPGRTVIDVGAGHHLGQQGGSERVALTAGQLPRHAHDGTTNNTDVSHNHTGSTVDPGDHTHGYWWISDGFFRAAGGGPVGNEVYRASRTFTSTGGSSTGSRGLAFYTDVTSLVHAHSFTTSEAGNNEDHENMQPYQASHFIIKY